MLQISLPLLSSCLQVSNFLEENILIRIIFFITVNYLISLLLFNSE